MYSNGVMKAIDLVYEIEEQCEYFARDIRTLNKCLGPID